MNCQHCLKEYTSKIGYSNHVRRCPSNPNRVMETLTQEGRQKLIQHRVDMNNKQWNDPAFKEKHRAAMKKAVLANPESYSSSNRGRTKQIIVDGIKLQGQWEVDFYLWAKSKGLEPKRPDQAFKYEWNGERWYHPDFYIKSLDLYIEVKGYETDRDRAKWLHFPNKLRIIKEAEIKQIRKGCFERL
jgi:prolyl oligopeptidase PreP (S9A serine peptidase family)